MNCRGDQTASRNPERVTDYHINIKNPVAGAWRRYLCVYSLLKWLPAFWLLPAHVIIPVSSRHLWAPFPDSLQSPLARHPVCPEKPFWAGQRVKDAQPIQGRLCEDGLGDVVGCPPNGGRTRANSNSGRRQPCSKEQEAGAWSQPRPRSSATLAAASKQVARVRLGEELPQNCTALLPSQDSRSPGPPRLPYLACVSAPHNVNTQHRPPNGSVKTATALASFLPLISADSP